MRTPQTASAARLDPVGSVTRVVAGFGPAKVGEPTAGICTQFRGGRN
jgi:hypothetical protein